VKPLSPHGAGLIDGGSAWREEVQYHLHLVCQYEIFVQTYGAGAGNKKIREMNPQTSSMTRLH
jgi:hypothetical protein